MKNFNYERIQILYMYILSSQEELDQDLVKVVRYEFHTFRYHTLLEVIFGLNGALRYLRKVN